MIKLKIRSRCYSLLASAACLFVISGNVSAMVATLQPTSLPNISYTLQVGQSFSNTTGSLSNKLDFNSASGRIVWKNEQFIGSDNYIGPQYFFSDFTPAIDYSNTTSFNGVKYYKIKADVGTNVPLYVAIKQYVYDNGNDVGNYYYVPYTQHNNSGTTVRVKGKDACEFVWSNSGDEWSCSNGNLFLEQNGTISGRSGTIYFYMPKVPTNDVTFTNLEIANTKIHTTIATDSWEEANNYSKNSVIFYGTVYFRFYLSGTFKLDQSCKISGGPVVLEVPLGDIAIPAFTTKGGKPSGYTPKATNLTFTCKRDIGKTYGAMKWSISPTSASSGSGMDGVLIAKPNGGNSIDGVGVKITSDSAGNTPVKLGGDNLQSATVSGNNATATFYAHPTMTKDTKPSGGGDFNATATVTFEVP
ncbi:fimbrial protein [Citrobacter braakii]|uniref:fimbrial protein n=1 Tax=Citrobacter braakii TaxID=57706 RepID=UPI0034E579B2